MKTPQTIMREAAKTFEERNPEYGDNWRKSGPILDAIFPDGIEIKGADEWSRFAIFMHIINKVSRIARNIKNGGHIDSSRDLSVYAAMLEALEMDNPMNQLEENLKKGNFPTVTRSTLELDEDAFLGKDEKNDA